jgi:hypothetical protein
MEEKPIGTVPLQVVDWRCGCGYLGGEIPHEVLVGFAEDVVLLGAVLREVEGRVLEDGDPVGEPLDHRLAAGELRGIVEVRHVRPDSVFTLASGPMLFLLI